ncbi:MAG: hypothetical protein AMXMBFR64_33090 [Myxococcales bacterium]
MSLNRTLRALAAASRRAERESARRYRERERNMRESAKLAEKDRARHEVELHDALIETLVSVHKDCSDPIDWKSLRDAAAPALPDRSSKNEDGARIELEGYRPGLFTRLFGLTARQRAKLEAAITEGRAMDDAAYRAACAAHDEQRAEWQEQRDLAARVLAGDLDAYVTVIQEMNPFAEIAGLGSSVSFSSDEATMIEATVRVNTDRVVPAESKSLLASGKLSVKAMTPARFNAIYQDYVCGAALRVARELLAILPVEAVDVTATVEGLDTATGRNDVKTILSVQVTRKVASMINFELADPSDCMKNFKHKMKFTKSGGFEPI